MNILHLSDIHFGRNNPEYKVKGKFQNKDMILEALLESISKTEFKPEHIVVTGDIAWFGRKQDFDEALVWFKKLLKVTNLSGKDITFCPGNHDVNRAYGNTNKKLSPKDIEKIDEMYQFDKVHEFEAPIYNYEKFCEQLGVIPYHYPKEGQWEASYSIGYKDIVSESRKTIRLVSFNTALLSYVQGYPDDQMLIGQKQVYDLIKCGIIGDKSPHFTIALFHHAERFLHPQEICEYNQRRATLPLLRKYVDLILCGHTETGGMPVLYQQIGGSEMLTGGAAYYADDHANAYSVIIIPDSWGEKVRKGILFDPYTYSESQGWHKNKAKEERPDIEVIDKKYPLMDIRSDFKLVFSDKEQEYTVPIKDISVFDRGSNIALISNSEDVCRNLDITCTGHTDMPGTAYLTIDLAGRKVWSIAAFLDRESIFGFCQKASKGVSINFRFEDESGQVFLSGDNLKIDGQVNQEVYEFLKKTRRIEEYYDVIFRCPDDTAEESKVDVINELIDRGFTSKLGIIQDATMEVADRNKLLKIGESWLFHKEFYIHCKDEFGCRLFGCDFSLGEASVIAGPYRVDHSGNILKALTFQKDDIRSVRFVAQKNTVCYLVTDVKKFNSAKRGELKHDFIGFGNLKADWGYIYEKQKKCR